MAADLSVVVTKLHEIHEQVPTVSGSATYCKECGYSLGDTDLCRTTSLLKNLNPNEALAAICNLHQPGADHYEMCVDCGWPNGGWCPTRKLVEDVLVGRT